MSKDQRSQKQKDQEALEQAVYMWTTLHLQSVSRIQNLENNSTDAYHEAHISLLTAYQSVIGLKKLYNMLPNKIKSPSIRTEIQKLESTVKGFRNIMMHYDEFHSGRGRGRVKNTSIDFGKMLIVNTINKDTHGFAHDYMIYVTWQKEKKGKIINEHSYYCMLQNLSRIVRCYNAVFAKPKIETISIRDHFFTESNPDGSFEFNIIDKIELPVIQHNLP